MANYITVTELKQHLNIETSYTADDVLLSGLTTTSTIAVQTYTNDGLSGYTGTTTPAPVKHATLLLAGHLYLNRNMVSFTSGVEIPYTYKFLLDPYKNYVVV
jgi:hypothetical protein